MPNQLTIIRLQGRLNFLAFVPLWEDHLGMGWLISEKLRQFVIAEGRNVLFLLFSPSTIIKVTWLHRTLLLCAWLLDLFVLNNHFLQGDFPKRDRKLLVLKEISIVIVRINELLDLFKTALLLHWPLGMLKSMVIVFWIYNYHRSAQLMVIIFLSTVLRLIKVFSFLFDFRLTLQQIILEFRLSTFGLIFDLLCPFLLLFSLSFFSLSDPCQLSLFL